MKGFILDEEDGVTFLQWAFPTRGYKWSGFRKPRCRVLNQIRGRLEELNINGGYDEYKSYQKKNSEGLRVSVVLRSAGLSVTESYGVSPGWNPA